MSAFLLIISPHWIWELQTEEPVKPIAELIKQHTPPQVIVYSSLSGERPSLEFYSDRQIIFQSFEELRQHWQDNHSVYLLIDLRTLSKLKLPQQTIVKDERLKSLGWVLAVKNRDSLLTIDHTDIINNLTAR